MWSQGRKQVNNNSATCQEWHYRNRQMIWSVPFLKLLMCLWGFIKRCRRDDGGLPLFLKDFAMASFTIHQFYLYSFSTTLIFSKQHAIPYFLSSELLGVREKGEAEKTNGSPSYISRPWPKWRGSMY